VIEEEISLGWIAPWEPNAFCAAGWAAVPKIAALVGRIDNWSLAFSAFNNLNV